MWSDAGWCSREWKGKEHATRQASFRPPRHIHVKQSRSTPFVLPFAARARSSLLRTEAELQCGAEFWQRFAEIVRSWVKN